MEKYSRLNNLIKLAIWHEGTAEADTECFREMKLHAITALAAPVLNEISMPPELRAAWEKEIATEISHYVRYCHMQTTLDFPVPYVILKGTSAGQYYPHPECRGYGDIDIMTRHEDYQAACDYLLQSGFIDITPEPVRLRHREFARNSTIVEVHAYFAILNEPEQAEYMDNLIIDSIHPDHVLPDLVNGLVLLEHISQHLEHGLGFRQILDWMMFVDKCLPDEKWPEFSAMAQKIGLTNLAVCTTQMCVMYLGLGKREWCSGADPEICSQLLDYVVKCGNFGIKWNEKSYSNAELLVSRMGNPIRFLSMLQGFGRANWKAVQKHPFLAHFAWMYQIVKYIRKGLFRKHPAATLKEEYEAGRRRKAMFEALGVKQVMKGRAYYINGKYVKEKAQQIV